MTPAIRSLVLAAGAASLVSAQGVYAAPVTARAALDPLVSLSVLGTAQSRAAVCAAGSAALSAGAAAAQAVAPGCVLPVVGQPTAPPPVSTSNLPPPPPISGGGLGINPLFILGGLLLGGVLLWVLLDNDDDDPELEPISPA